MELENIIKAIADFGVYQISNDKFADGLLFAIKILKAYDADKPFTREDAESIIEQNYAG